MIVIYRCSKVIQLEQVTKQANKLAETLKSLQEKRSTYRHDQQLEELRNLQVSFDANYILRMSS